MLVKSLRSASNVYTSLFKMPMRFASTKKDYYDILGLNRDATLDEIKDAYRTLAKRYHPDVNATGEAYEGDASKFRDVVEAYQVLSVFESRTAYDLQNQANPDSIFRGQRMEQYRKYAEREPKTGQPKKEAYPPESYAEERRKILEEERKKYNVDYLGRYKGGVPQKGRLGLRGSALGHPGAFHDPLVHNLKQDADPSWQFVTSKDALTFKFYQNEDRYAILKKWTWFQASVDYDFFKFKEYRMGWRYFRNIVLIVFGLSGIAEIFLKYDRRALIDRVRALAQGQDIRKGIVLEGKNVKLTENGILKFEEAAPQPHHHH